jgi:hypothetical protein
MTDTKQMKRSKICICEECGHQTEIQKRQKSRDDDHNLQTKLIRLNDEVYKSKNLPICVEIKHNGFWITNEHGVHISTLDERCDKNSIMLSNDCLLYIYKIALRHLLLSMKVITPQDIDPANLVPHIKVRENKYDNFSKYKLMQNKKYIISDKEVSVKKDFITIEVDRKNDLHCTLIYSKKIGDKVDLFGAFALVIQTLNTYPELIKQYSDLPYFGQKCMNYWYNCPDKYPFNVQLDDQFNDAHTNNEVDYNSIKISPAGSII